MPSAPLFRMTGGAGERYRLFAMQSFSPDNVEREEGNFSIERSDSCRYDEKPRALKTGDSGHA